MKNPLTGILNICDDIGKSCLELSIENPSKPPEEERTPIKIGQVGRVLGGLFGSLIPFAAVIVTDNYLNEQVNYTYAIPSAILTTAYFGERIGAEFRALSGAFFYAAGKIFSLTYEQDHVQELNIVEQKQAA